MYNYKCDVHGWSSHCQQCPSCTVISVADSSAPIPDFCYTSIKVSELENLKQIIKDYEEALENIIDLYDALYPKEHEGCDDSCSKKYYEIESLKDLNTAREVLKKHRGNE